MSPSSETILSLLPKLTQPVPGESFPDRVVLLLAAMATAEGRLGYCDYQLAQGACRRIFGDRALHAELQAKLHHALLHPPVDTSSLVSGMACQARLENVPDAFVRKLLEALACFAEPGGPESRAHSMLQEAEAAFRNPAADTPARTGPFPTFHVGEVGGRLGEWCRLAVSSLPRLTRGGPVGEKRGASNALEKSAAALESVVRELNDEKLSEELHAFRKIIRAQPFKVVVVGERKRGKSSLVNALLSQTLSPVGESAPETAVIIAFRYAATPDYTVRFLNDRQFGRLEEYLAREEGNRLLSRKIERIRQGLADGTFVPGKLLSGITSREEIGDYTRVSGRFSGFVGRVSVGLPLDALADGIELSDTPGLNDTDRFHDFLAYEESLEADCLIFAMDARDPGTHSELELLRRLARSGRSVSVIGVLTNPDRLEDVSSLERAREQARCVLEEACRLSPHVRPLGVVAVNARQAMELRGGNAPVPGEFDRLLGLVREALETDSGKAAYRLKVAENYTRLAGDIRERLRHYAAQQLAALPGPDMLAMLDAHADQLAEATRLSVEQARQVVGAAAEDMEAWDRETERALARFEETLVLRLMEAINAKVALLGRQFAKDSAWKAFDAEEAAEIARRSVDEFLEQQRDVLRTWEKKIQMFSERLNECSQSCLNRAAGTVAGLDGTTELMFSESGKATYFLVQTHHYMKNIAVFATGAAVGRASLLSPLTLLVSAGNILALAITSPMLAAVVAAMAGAAGVVYHLGREDKRKAAFLERRRKEAETYARRIASALREELNRARSELGNAYEVEVRCGFTPALESLFYQSAHLRLFLDVMRKIHLDVSRYDEHVRLRLEEIGQGLIPRSAGRDSPPGRPTQLPL